MNTIENILDAAVAYQESKQTSDAERTQEAMGEFKSSLKAFILEVVKGNNRNEEYIRNLSR